SLVTGTVMVVARDGSAHYGQINPDGTYRIDGVPVGPTRLTVSSPDPRANATVGRGTAPGMPGKPARGEGARPASPPAGDTRRGGGAGTADTAAGETPRVLFPNPEQYGDPNKVGLTLDLREGTNPLGIGLD